MAAASKRAQQVANLPYKPYTGETVAGLSPDTTSAFDLARQSIGMTDPYYNAALGLIGEYGGYSGVGTAQDAFSAYGNPDQYSALDTISPVIGQIAPELGKSSAGYAQNLISQYGGGRNFPDAVGEYMSPYTDQVLDQIAQRGERNLTENLLPNVNKTFIGSGTFGGQKNLEMTNRALRDTQEAILGEQAGALESGYKTAADIFNQDQSRAGSLAGNMGSLYGSDVSRTLSGGTNLAQLMAGTGSSDAARQAQMAQYITSLGGADAQNSANLANMLMQYGGDVYNQNLKDISMLEGLGQTQQQQEQNQINASMGKYQQAQDYPYKQLQTLISPLQQISWPTTQTTTQSQSGGSPFGQILGGLLSVGSMAAGMPGMGSMFGAGAGAGGLIPGGFGVGQQVYSSPIGPMMFKKGGPVMQRYADGGPVRERMEAYLDPNIDMETLIAALEGSRTGKSISARPGASARLPRQDMELPVRRRESYPLPSRKPPVPQEKEADNDFYRGETNLAARFQDAAGLAELLKKYGGGKAKGGRVKEKAHA